MTSEAIRPITSALGEFVASHRYADLPGPVVNEAKRAIADCIGGAIAGVPTEVGRIAVDLVASEPGSSSIWGTRIKSTARNAALANGALAHAHDFDDTNDSMRGHPSAPLVPAIFALGDETGVSGEALIAAYVVGVEIEAKLGRAMNMEHYERGWHTTSTLGTLGAAAGAANLLGLDAEASTRALAIAASMACGLRANFGTMTKPMHAGFAAQNGVLAARLAQAGLGANPDAIEAREGFFDLFCGTGNVVSETIVSALAAPYDVISPGIIYKKYPTCSLTHLALDLLLEGLASGEIVPDDIEQVRCGVGFRCANTLPYHDATNGLEGKFSMEYCVAAALVYGRAGIAEFEDDAVRNPKVRDMLAKIGLYTHPDLISRDSVDRDFTDIEIVHRSGRVFRGRLSKPKGNPANPLSWEELGAKFEDCAASILGEAATRQLWLHLRHLERHQAADVRVAA